MLKCKKNTICINNIIVLFIFIIILFLTIYFYNAVNRKNIILYKERENIESNKEHSLYYTNPNQLLSTLPKDTFLNPYVPPQRENHGYMTTNIRGRDSTIGHTIHYPSRALSIHTNRNVSPYQQIGILTRGQGEETILPLFGREIDTRRNKWNYYTMTSHNNMIKLPVSYRGKSCTKDQGCDELFNGDSVYVEGYKDIFNATIYENNTMDYIP